jgi:hypothetical protein
MWPGRTSRQLRSFQFGRTHSDAFAVAPSAWRLPVVDRYCGGNSNWWVMRDPIHTEATTDVPMKRKSVSWRYVRDRIQFLAFENVPHFIYKKQVSKLRFYILKKAEFGLDCPLSGLSKSELLRLPNEDGRFARNFTSVAKEDAKFARSKRKISRKKPNFAFLETYFCRVFSTSSKIGTNLNGNAPEFESFARNFSLPCFLKSKFALKIKVSRLLSKLASLCFQQ